MGKTASFVLTIVTDRVAIVRISVRRNSYGTAVVTVRIAKTGIDMSCFSDEITLFVVTIGITAVVEVMDYLASVITIISVTVLIAIVIVKMIYVYPFSCKSHILADSHSVKIPYSSEAHPFGNLVTGFFRNARCNQLRS